MSEYWVSKKKYFCKYCDIYIADDAPSRQHHENGMRHKGNLERYIRSIYKTGEKRKKEAEEEKREMAAIERAANAAFAGDVGAGLAKAPVASTSAAAARKPAPGPARSSNPYANYTTAAELGITDPDEERRAAEAALRKSQGVAGEWEVVSVTPPPLPAEPSEEDVKDVKPATEELASAGDKRPAEEEDEFDFKIRKKRLNTGLGEIYDPGLIPIKLKKKEEPPTEPVPGPSTAQAQPAPSGETKLQWTPLSLKPGESTSTKAESSSEGTEARAQPGSTASKWSKSSWGAPSEEVHVFPDPPLAPSATASTSEEAKPAVKEEEAPETKPTLPDPAEAPAPMFKKRKAPQGAGRGRRVI